jgi:hypothetical protein
VSLEFLKTPTSRVAEFTEEGTRTQHMLFPLDIAKSRFSPLRRGRRADVWPHIVHEQTNVSRVTSPDTF